MNSNLKNSRREELPKVFYKGVEIDFSTENKENNKKTNKNLNINDTSLDDHHDFNKFSEIHNLNKNLLSNLHEVMKFNEMTSIQKVVYPIIDHSKDVMACSKTGI